MTTAQPMDKWNALPWKRFERQVFKLQKRIYHASRRGETTTVHKLQRLLMRSWAAKCLAVRKVTQDNQGKKTAGVDGVKTLTSAQRLRLARTLRLTAKAHPTRRVWIPKPGKTERRPLGIPTMADRAAQALAKLALEPEWEAKFEPNSYGFRPGRSTHDAIEAIWTAINRKAKFVLDADIAKCFDRINHQALLTKLRTFPTFRRAIKGWLQAGVMDGPELFPTPEGTPQGGVISPLLANIALHGLEEAVTAAFPASIRGITWQPRVIRYADDFVVLHHDLATIERVREVIEAWLAELGLELKPSKTRITHTLHRHQGNVGFDFLGFHVRQFPVGKMHTGKVANGSGAILLGFKTIITPSKDALARHLHAVGEVIYQNRSAPQPALVGRLNPLITGWTRYFATVCSKDTFAKAAHLTFCKLWRWAKRRHPHKSRRWVAQRYWRRNQGHWNFAPADGPRLLRHDRRPIRRHIKVQHTRSPFDGDWAYWGARLGRHPELSRREAILLKWQKGLCAWCGLAFHPEDLLEVDHIIPRDAGGKDGYLNWQLLHHHCHDTKTARDRALATGGSQ